MLWKVTLHVEGAGVDCSRLSTRISSIVSGVLITRCGGIHLNKHAIHELYNKQYTVNLNTGIIGFWMKRFSLFNLKHYIRQNINAIYQSTLYPHYGKKHWLSLATRWQEGVCRRWRQTGSSPVEENTAAMACWAQRRLESQCTVSTSSSSQDPSDIALPGLQPLPKTHSVSARTHTMHSVSQHTHIHIHTHPPMHTLYKQYPQTSTITFSVASTET